MELEYVYTKCRSEFGKQCLFSDRNPEMIDECRQSQRLARDFIFRNPVHQYSQCSEIFAAHAINTDSTKVVSSSMNHSEGGWPKDVNLLDEDQPKRYRRKIQREENYVNTVSKLANNIEQMIVQNTSMDIYQHYYLELEHARHVELSSARTVNVYQDPSMIKRPISHISWSPGNSHKLAASYCNLTFQHNFRKSNNSYIWEVENPNMPQLILKPPAPLVCLEYHLKDANCLVAGMLNGLISLWDERRGNDMVTCTIVEESHQDPVRSLIWINSKTGSEFFSGSSDGQVKWWDIRKLSAPTETLILDMVKFGEEQQFTRAQCVSCLEYEPTIPTRFMVGTENGTVINGNRKGKNAHEKLVSKINISKGPVYALQRNTAYTKIFMAVNDCNCEIWSEECKEDSVISTNEYSTSLTDGQWSPSRYSVFYLTRFDGNMDIWDILQNQKNPMVKVKLSDDPLTTIRIHELGQLAAIGSQNGTLYLVKMSDNFCNNLDHEKALLGQMFDRETLKEKTLESRLREMRLKASPGVVIEDEVQIERSVEVEAEFYRVIEAELNPKPTQVEPLSLIEEEIIVEERIPSKTKSKEKIIESITTTPKKKKRKK